MDPAPPPAQADAVRRVSGAPMPAGPASSSATPARTLTFADTPQPRSRAADEKAPAAARGGAAPATSPPPPPSYQRLLSSAPAKVDTPAATTPFRAPLPLLHAATSPATVTPARRSAIGSHTAVDIPLADVPPGTRTRARSRSPLHVGMRAASSSTSSLAGTPPVVVAGEDSQETRVASSGSSDHAAGPGGGAVHATNDEDGGNDDDEDDNDSDDLRDPLEIDLDAPPDPSLMENAIFRHQYRRHQELKMLGGMRKRIFIFLEAPDSILARLYSFFYILMVLVAVILTLIESSTQYYMKHPPWWPLDVFFCFFFTGDVITRICVAPRRFRYLMRTLTILDILSVVPYWIDLLYTTPDVQALVALRTLRILRILQVFKHMQNSTLINITLRSLSRSKEAFLLVLLYSGLSILLTAAAIYYAERGAYDPQQDMWVLNGAPSPFQSIPDGFYWAITTLSTTGYGDVTPKTDFGKFVAGFTMLIGVSILALPVSILGSHFMSEWMEYQRLLLKTKIHHGAAVGLATKRTKAAQIKFLINQNDAILQLVSQAQDLLNDVNPTDSYIRYKKMKRKYQLAQAQVRELQAEVEKWKRLAKRFPTYRTEINRHVDEMVGTGTIDSARSGKGAAAMAAAAAAVASMGGVVATTATTTSGGGAAARWAQVLTMFARSHTLPTPRNEHDPVIAWADNALTSDHDHHHDHDDEDMPCHAGPSTASRFVPKLRLRSRTLSSMSSRSRLAAIFTRRPSTLGTSAHPPPPTAACGGVQDRVD
ncbi:hypothetical protein AMAG_16515 [Allomyces macrogynus ATCC 38327]|uniref:Ion transport domain-containing protein n=1 Tax=Allomyces macrogynus (strain ATCC 38327) TaxID=578462 RepID=A0A0L0TCL9_ALLM3|nr:hypothetical protein AMAG_16515 [Allomyces macrogynus ATCC 38327]|eukprot:KNE72472.1 hypothetical protein AMAG_16515 [Allomyces macrogynus ATCC 38327]